jgi:hypothetical protein
MSSHSHKCPKCETVWSHGDNCGGNDKAHECPKCGAMSWFKYFGKKAVDIVQGSCEAVGRVGEPVMFVIDLFADREPLYYDNTLDDE